MHKLALTTHFFGWANHSVDNNTQDRITYRSLVRIHLRKSKTFYSISRKFLDKWKLNKEFPQYFFYKYSQNTQNCDTSAPALHNFTHFAPVLALPLDWFPSQFVRVTGVDVRRQGQERQPISLCHVGLLIQFLSHNSLRTRNIKMVYSKTGGHL